MVTSYPSFLFCLVAVYNRVETTRVFLAQLLGQKNVSIKVIVVDDGSTDGTAAMLENFAGLDLQIIRGSGNLWWGGAMRLGMEEAFAQMGETNALIMLNDDIRIDEHFLSRFCERARELGPRVVIGCQQRDVANEEYASLGYKLNYPTCRMDEVTKPVAGSEIIEVDALCGRGMLVSREVVAAVGFVDAKRFPHYLGDIEYSARIKDYGFRVVCDQSIIVSTLLSAADEQRLAKKPWRRFLSATGSKNILQHYRFWASRGPKFLARTAVFRFPFVKLSRALRQAAYRH